MNPRSLRADPRARWLAMGLLAFTMFSGYFVADVASPLKPLIEQELGWTSSEYGLYTSAYGWFNVFLGMIVIGGIILDRVGVRFAGTLAMVLMLIGCIANYVGMLPETTGYVWHQLEAQVILAAFGYAVFGVGLELCGITATKAVARWFHGYELALAMGLQVAIARLGTALALGIGAPIATATSRVAAPVLFGGVLLALGLLVFLFYRVLDQRLDESEKALGPSAEEQFRVSDIGAILRNKGFWLIALLCSAFYSAVFPFLKYAADLMVQKFGMAEAKAGLIPALLPFGTIFLTPLFGRVYDKKGKGATMMVLGSVMILFVHIALGIPKLSNVLVAFFAVLILGVGFSLVPSAMWPSVRKLVPERQLGTAYALIFWLQNLIALTLVPLLIGVVLDKFCVIERTQDQIRYNYTLPMLIFAGFGVLAVLLAVGLLAEDKKKGYGLERPNQP